MTTNVLYDTTPPQTRGLLRETWALLDQLRWRASLERHLDVRCSPALGIEILILDTAGYLDARREMVRNAAGLIGGHRTIQAFPRPSVEFWGFESALGIWSEVRTKVWTLLDVADAARVGQRPVALVPGARDQS